MRGKAPRRTACERTCSERTAVAPVKQVWAMDFMGDKLSDGRKFRVLAVLDLCTREWLMCRWCPGRSSVCPGGGQCIAPARTLSNNSGLSRKSTATSSRTGPGVTHAFRSVGATCAGSVRTTRSVRPFVLVLSRLSYGKVRCGPSPRTAHPVNKTVDSPKNEGPRCIEPD